MIEAPTPRCGGLREASGLREPPRRPPQHIARMLSAYSLLVVGAHLGDVVRRAEEARNCTPASERVVMIEG